MAGVRLSNRRQPHDMCRLLHPHMCTAGRKSRRAAITTAKLILAFGMLALLNNTPEARTFHSLSFQHSVGVAASNLPLRLFTSHRSIATVLRATGPSSGESSSSSTAAKPEAVQAAEASTAVASQTSEVKAPAAGEQKEEGGKRLRQFLALEPLDDDPTEGNQWKVDSRDGDISDQDARKRATAIVTGLVSIGVTALYVFYVYTIENRDLTNNVAGGLSSEEVALIEKA